eukprot:EC849598.1.p2 GENE.EC849598.1~~EC849598.1.p2  ORF type:complete len:163 (+),score=29.64 EC849598.1:43-489(+)
MSRVTLLGLTFLSVLFAMMNTPEAAISDIFLNSNYYTPLAGTIIGVLSAVDTVPTNTYTYQVMGGTHFTWARIFGGNQLAIACDADVTISAVDTMNLIVQVKDQNGNIFTKTFNIHKRPNTVFSTGRVCRSQARMFSISHPLYPPPWQ